MYVRSGYWWSKAVHVKRTWKLKNIYLRYRLHVLRNYRLTRVAAQLLWQTLRSTWEICKSIAPRCFETRVGTRFDISFQYGNKRKHRILLYMCHVPGSNSLALYRPMSIMRNCTLRSEAEERK